jgi:hypothetical protein
MVADMPVNRGAWSDGLGVAELSRKIGCRVSCRLRTAYNRDRWNGARSAVRLIQKAGIDVGIFGDKGSVAAGGHMPWVMRTIS